MKIAAIIPARGGSKGLINKNILPLLGHPLIAYSIKAGLDAVKIDRVIVSTDSAEIAAIAKSYGAEVPFMRPARFAQDMSTDMEVFKHALDWLGNNEEYVPDILVQLRPTSPVRFAAEIDLCIDKLISSNADSLRIVTPAPCTPYKMWRVNESDGLMEPLLKDENIKEPFNEPRQRLPKVYWQVGTLDVIRTSSIREKNSLSGNNILSHIISNELSVDIDDMIGFKKAEQVILHNHCVQF
ncbi:MAG TPA: acylneuraminate cytidylyltransferase family protein [Panacibacter sp.]|nr:acylneuraminate cytidylyltransferase family protein [Panacibacter sp.]